MADLVSTVWVTGEDSEPVSFAPGDDIPQWAADQMGDHCFVDGKRPAKRAAKSSPKSD